MNSIIITGASKGIGKALSLHFAKKVKYMLLIARSELCLKTLQDAIYKLNPGCIVHLAAIDVFESQLVEASVNAFLKLAKSVDLLVNNAGFVKRGTSDLNPEALSEMVNTNLIGAVNVIQSVVPNMVSHNSGYIINLSSRNAKIPRAFLGGYAATKASILAYSESLYKELASKGVKVTALCPGFVDTEMTSEVDLPRDSLIQTDDICRTIEFLLSLSSSVACKELGFESVRQVGAYC